MNNLKKLRNKNNLTQKEIANDIGISQTGYSNYELNKRDISTIFLKKLANYYQVSIDYLLGITNVTKEYPKQNTINNENRLKIIRLKHNFTQEYLSKVLKISRSCYAKYELSTIDIPTKVLIFLAYFYNTSIDYLLYYTDNFIAHKKINIRK